MLGLARWLPANRVGNARPKSKRRPLCLELLEDRVVPTLLGQQLFPADYPWNQIIANAPVVSNSAAIIANIGNNIGIHPDWGEDSTANGNDPLYGIPVNIVHGNSVAKVTVIIDDYPDESDLLTVPIPANARIEGDYQNGSNPFGPGYDDNQRGDSHLLIWDVDNNIAYELFGAARPSDPITMAGGSTGGVWHAAQESVWNMSANSFRSLGDTSADAAGLSLLAGLARPDEGLPTSKGGQGEIDHALRFTLPSSKILPQYLYPASHVVNVSSGANKLPFGARLRLMDTPAVNQIIATLGPEAQIIAHAMQQYGLVLADIGSSMYVTGTSSSTTINNTIGLTWDMDDVLGLSALKASSFEVVNLTPTVTGLSATTAAAGGTITVIGQNFSGSAGHLAVLFGSVVSTSVTYVDDSHITALVPAGSGTVNVTVRSGVVETDPNSPTHNVTNPVFGYGTSAVTSADQFTYGVTQTISGANSTVSFASSTVAAGVGDVVTIVVKDTLGNAVGGLPSGAFSLVLSNGSSSGNFGAVSATATQGTYTTTFTGATAGTASTLLATVGGAALSNTPTITVNIGAISASNSTVSFAAPTVTLTATDLVTIFLKDVAGNPITGLANSAFTLSLSGGSTGTFAAVTGTGGTYTSTFTSTGSGTASALSAIVNGITLANHPSVTVNGPTTFSDNFTSAGANQQLPSTWTNQLGSFTVNTTARTATGVSAINLATVNGVSNANEALSAVVTVAAKQLVGLVARQVGPGDRNMYYGAVLGGAGTFTSYIYRNVNGVWTKLYTKVYTGVVSNATLEFDVIGSSLRLFLNGKIIAFANDTTFTAAGAIGMRGTAGAVLKNFVAGPMTLANRSLPFSDNFNTAGANGQLTTSWFNQIGNIQVTNGTAVGVGKLNMATVSGISAANVSVQADVTVSTIGQAAGLVARYGGSGEKNMYFAAVSQTGKNTYAVTLHVNVNGVWKLLKSVTVSAGSGTLKLVMSGNSMTITYRGSTLFTITNASFTAPGTVGLRLTAGASADNFSVS